MADIFVASSGSNTSPYDTWAKAATTLATALAAATASTDRIIVSIAQAETAGASTTGPADGPRIQVFTATAGSGSDWTYTKESTSYNLGRGNSHSFDGAFAVTGLWVYAYGFTLDGDATEGQTWRECTFQGTNASSALFSTGAGATRIIDCNIIPVNSSSSTVVANLKGNVEIVGLTCSSNGSNRTGPVFQFSALGDAEIRGSDLSAFTNASAIFTDSATLPTKITFSDCKLPSGVALFSAATYSQSTVMFQGCGTGDDRTQLYLYTPEGTTTSSTNERTGGASFDSVAYSWKCEDNSTFISKGSPAYTPWFYAYNGTAGSAVTFTTYIANETGSLTDTDVWLEVEYPVTANTVTTKIVTDRNADQFVAGTNQDSDAVSAWPDLTETAQKLVITTNGTTIPHPAEKGMVRARVGWTTGTTFYVDPVLNIS